MTGHLSHRSALLVFTIKGTMLLVSLALYAEFHLFFFWAVIAVACNTAIRSTLFSDKWRDICCLLTAPKSRTDSSLVKSAQLVKACVTSLRRLQFLAFENPRLPIVWCLCDFPITCCWIYSGFIPCWWTPVYLHVHVHPCAKKLNMSMTSLYVKQCAKATMKCVKNKTANERQSLNSGTSVSFRCLDG